jgi:hypothetical protein
MSTSRPRPGDLSRPRPRCRCSTSGVALTEALRAEAVRRRRHGRAGPVSPSSFRAGLGPVRQCSNAPAGC